MNKTVAGKINLVDVGCGQNIDKVWRENKEKINFFLGFDPDDDVEAAKKMSSDRAIYNSAVFDVEEERDFYVCNKATCSSLFPPHPEEMPKYTWMPKAEYNHKRVHRCDVKEIKKVKCIRLDTVISELDINFDFLKMDTQGADYNVLKSIGDYLSTQIVGVQTEVFFKELYEGIHLYKETDEFLKKNGFIFVKNLRKPNEYHGEYLYIREDDSKQDKVNLIKKIYGIK